MPARTEHTIIANIVHYYWDVTQSASELLHHA